MADALLALPSSPHYFVLPSPTMSELGCLTEVCKQPHLLLLFLFPRVLYVLTVRYYRIPLTPLSSFKPFLLLNSINHSLYFHFSLTGFWRSFLCEKQFLWQQVNLTDISAVLHNCLSSLSSDLFYPLRHQLSGRFSVHHSCVFSTLFSHPYPTLLHPTLLSSSSQHSYLTLSCPAFFSVDY